MYSYRNFGLRRGFFSSVADLADFLTKFDSILTNPVEGSVDDPWLDCVVQKMSPNGDKKYWVFRAGRCAFNHMSFYKEPVNKKTGHLLKKLMGDIEYIFPTELDDCGLQMQIRYQPAKGTNNKQRPSLDYIKVHSDNEGNLKVSLNGHVGFSIRTSTAFYQEVLEIAKYSKHKTDISASMPSIRIIYWKRLN